MTRKNQLKLLFERILEEARTNKRFARDLQAILQDNSPVREKRSPRRSPGVINPYEHYEKGEAQLRGELERLSLDQLKDIVAEHGMGSVQLALKWRTPDRLINLIMDTVRSRAHKGDAFRSRQAVADRAAESTEDVTRSET